MMWPRRPGARDARRSWLGCWTPAAGSAGIAPANFTYAAHQALLAGFLPTPYGPGPHPRLFAAEFPGSETTVAETWTFPQANLVQALEAVGYQSICIGGVGFFNKRTALGRTLPDMFQQSYWEESLGVTCRQSTENQVALARRLIDAVPRQQRLFLFINVSALHQPNSCVYLPGAVSDSPVSQLEALVYVDRCLPPLLQSLSERGALFGIICSDHGTAYGEEGCTGHRWNHPVVGDVPYTDFVLTDVVRAE